MSKKERSDVGYTSLAHIFPWPRRSSSSKRRRTRPTYKRVYDWRIYRELVLLDEFGDGRHSLEDAIVELKARGAWDDLPTEPHDHGSFAWDDAEANEYDDLGKYLGGCLVLRLEHLTDEDIDWSYASVYRDEDGNLQLPESFDGDGALGRRVPQRFHKALAKWQRQHEGDDETIL